MYAIIDEEDFDKVKDYRWRAIFSRRAGRYYAGAAKSILMHRLILNAPNGMMVDHIKAYPNAELNGLDNRKSNLRLANASQNAAHSVKRITSRSPYKGIWFIKETSRWRSSIRVNYKRIYLGCFAKAKEAAMAYDRAAIKHFGEFALINFPVLK